MVLSDWDEMDITEMLSQTRLHGDMSPFDHGDLTERIKRSLYYDPMKKPDQDTLSFSVTESAVSHFRHVAPMPSGKLGHRYASRVAREACISPCALLLGLIYIERLKLKNQNYLENISSSDLFLVSMMVASKYLFDEGCDDEVFNDEWAVSGETEVEKVNRLEREFLKAIDWQLYVNPKEFSSMLNAAESNVALSNGHKRGWLTYSDLRSLFDCHSIYKQMAVTAGLFSKATCMCMIMYSGLMCLAAVTSTTLVLSRNATPFGPRLHRNEMDADNHENRTLLYAEVAVDPDNGCSTSGLFPGFSSEFTASCQDRSFNRIRYRSVEREVNDIEPHFRSSAVDDDKGIVTESFDSKEKSSSNAPCKRSSFSFFEAVLLMAHVPVLCTNVNETPDKCHNCGKEIQDVKKSPPIWHKNSLSSATAHQKSRDDMGISPHRSTSSFALNRNRWFGVYNPTRPPMMDPMPNVTYLGGLPVAVH